MTNRCGFLYAGCGRCPKEWHLRKCVGCKARFCPWHYHTHMGDCIKGTPVRTTTIKERI